MLKMQLDLGLTGPALRGSGVPYDVRKATPYLGYENYDFEVPVQMKAMHIRVLSVQI